MSIINEALKKAGEDKIFSPDHRPRKKFLVWGIAIILCLAVVKLFTNSSRSSINSGSGKELASTVENADNAFHLRKINFEAPINTANFNLSGIVYDQQKPMAIINGNVVCEGASIEGAQLLEIQPNYVKLSLKGKEFKIEVK